MEIIYPLLCDLGYNAPIWQIEKLTSRRKYAVIVADTSNRHSLYIVLDPFLPISHIATLYYNIRSSILAHILLILGIRNLKSITKANNR